MTQVSAAYGEIINNNRWDKTSVFYKNKIIIYAIHIKPPEYIPVQKNKEQAFDLLMNVMFNKDFNNIITYGKEGKQYEIKDGKVKMKLMNLTPTVNNMI